jgi:hypothetical protein
MLVQISPWDTSRTSVKLTSDSDSNNKRRRKTKGSTDDEHRRDTNDLDTRNFTFAASFVKPTTKRGLAKWKARSTEFNGYVPLLSVTTGHRISVIGRSTHTKKHNSDDDDDGIGVSPILKSQSSYREFSTLQYNCRPGNSGSFFPSNESDLPPIPAIVDFENERIYAVQKNNQRLCCWDLWEARGPDDRSALKVDLISPALSVSFLSLNTGVIYGTCQNGNVFVAKLILGLNSTAPSESSTTRSKTNQLLVVDYLPYQCPKGAIHIGTFAETRLDDKERVRGRKRKISGADGCSVFVIYQAFYDESTVRIVRHHTQFFSTMTEFVLEKDGHAQKVATIVDLKSIKDGGRPHSITGAQLLTPASGSTPRVTLVYTVSDGFLSTDSMGNGGHPEQAHGSVGKFCASLSLVTGTFVCHPIRVRWDMKQFSLVTENVLACTSKGSIYLYDMMSGAIIFNQCLSKALPGIECSWAMMCCTRSSTIAMLYSTKGEKNYLSLSAAKLECTGTSLGSSHLRASTRLIGSLLASSSACEMPRFVSGSPVIENSDVGVEDTVKDALAKLKSCWEKHILGDLSCHPYNRVFNECITLLTSDSCDGGNHDVQPLNGNNMPHNPQDPSTPYFKQASYSKNPPKRLAKKRVDVETLNGFVNNSKCKTAQMSPTLPQSFIDGAVQITLEAIHFSSKEKGLALSSVGSDARLVLRNLLRSGRISARLHFEGSYSLRETTKKHPLYIMLREMQGHAGNNPLPATQLVVELLQNCRDLSEHQLVIMLDFVMKFPIGEEVVETIFESSAMAIQMEHIRKLSHDSRHCVVASNKRTNSRQHSELSIGRTSVDENVNVAGKELLLQVILCYSEVNDIMLPIALSATLDSPAEVKVVAQLLCRMLKCSPSNFLSHRKWNLCFVPSTCRWISSLCESFVDVLKETRSPCRTDYFTFLYDAIRYAVRNSQVIISFKDGIGLAELVMEKEQQRDILAIETSVGRAEEDLPGYSINRCLI